MILNTMTLVERREWVRQAFQSLTSLSEGSDAWMEQRQIIDKELQDFAERDNLSRGPMPSEVTL